jgi:hypothetical protein
VVAANDVARRVAELKSSSRGMGEEHTSMANAKLHQDIDAWNDWDGEDEYDENGNVDLTVRRGVRGRRRNLVFRSRRSQR